MKEWPRREPKLIEAERDVLRLQGKGSRCEALEVGDTVLWEDFSNRKLEASSELTSTCWMIRMTLRTSSSWYPFEVSRRRRLRKRESRFGSLGKPQVKEGLLRNAL